jgi:hypothetical protein
MYFSKKTFPPMSEDIKKYIKESNTKIFNNHQLQASKMKINHIFENEKEDNNNDYFFYELNDINDENNKNNKNNKNNENKSKLIEIKNNNVNIEKYNNIINNQKLKILYVLSTSSIFMIITYIISYKYYLHIRRI